MFWIHFYNLVSAELNNIPTETTSSNCTGSVLYSSYTNSMMSVLIVLSTEEVKIHIANSWLQYLHTRTYVHCLKIIIREMSLH